MVSTLLSAAVSALIWGSNPHTRADVGKSKFDLFNVYGMDKRSSQIHKIDAIAVGSIEIPEHLTVPSLCLLLSFAQWLWSLPNFRTFFHKTDFTVDSVRSVGCAKIYRFAKDTYALRSLYVRNSWMAQFTEWVAQIEWCEYQVVRLLGQQFLRFAFTGYDCAGG